LSARHLLYFTAPIPNLRIMKLLRVVAVSLAVKLSSAVYTGDVIQYCRSSWL
jgi:hypothetical protein